MPFSKQRFRIGLAILAVALPALGQVAGDGNDFTEQQKAEFLRTAQVIKSKQSDVGVTNPFRLTLSDGTVTHDGNFQAVDINKTRENFSGGRVEYNFKDSYKYNIAAYQLAKLIGMDDMVPVTVERRWD